MEPRKVGLCKEIQESSARIIHLVGQVQPFNGSRADLDILIDALEKSKKMENMLEGVAGYLKTTCGEKRP